MRADPLLHQTLGGCRIDSVLGRGGMGVVYCAEQLRLSRKVALKVIGPELSEDDQFRRRFEQEARVAAAIDSPHVVTVYEAGDDEGRLFLVMRLVTGSDLRAMLGREGRLAPGRAVAILSEVAEALDAA